MKQEKIKKAILIAVAYHLEQEKNTNTPTPKKQWCNSSRETMMRNLNQKHIA
jgi:hypothetical protein